VPIRDAHGRIVRWFGTNTDVTAQHEAGEYQEMLTREMSHRVRNSLALVASFITLQARSASEPPVRRALEDIQGRVTAIANLHDQLWRSLSLQTIELAAFLDAFCAKLQDAAPQHRLIFKGDAVMVPTDVAIPSALLVNELVTNAFKHAFPTQQRGEVTVCLHPSPESIRLEVCDNGVGLPSGFSIEAASHSLGKRVILAFARQLGGTLSAESHDRGACFSLTMPRPQRR
jgi:two-component sensor histidine kinase